VTWGGGGGGVKMAKKRDVFYGRPLRVWYVTVRELLIADIKKNHQLVCVTAEV